MKKSLIALAVASVFIAPVALAQSSVYGTAHVSLDARDTGATGAETKRTTVSSAGSRLGFKGSEDLGNGLSAFFTIETGIATDAPTATTLGDRDTSTGLTSKTMGSVMLGHSGTPLKGATRGLDLFDGTVAGNNGLMANDGAFNADGGNGLTYVSPDLSGVTVTLGKGFTESALASAGSGEIHASVTYQAGSLYGFVAHGTISTGLLTETQTTSFGGSYGIGAFQLNAVFDRNENTSSIGAVTEWTATYFAGKYNISKTDAVKLAITDVNNSKIGSVTTVNGDRQSVIGYDHNLSKDTKVYALYSRLTPNVAPKVTSTIASIGLMKNF